MEGPALHLSQIDADLRKFKGFVNVPYQSWSSGTTVADLEKEIASQTGLRVAFIAYRGARLTKDTQLSKLILDLHQGSKLIPRFSVHTTSGDNIFFVKSLKGNSIMLDMPLKSTTVTELKEEVAVLENIPTNYQRFIYKGQQIADDELSVCRDTVKKTLHDFGVERDSTLHLVTRLRGGGTDVPASIEFSDLQNQKALKVLNWSKTAPVWRIVDKGLNLEGKCTNKACPGNGQLVICRKGFVAVNLSKEQGTCPICKQGVQVKTCSFTSCMWMYEGRKAITKSSPSRGLELSRRRSKVTNLLTKCFSGKSPTDDDCYPKLEKQQDAVGQDIVSPWYRASDKYEYFKRANNMVKWENLIIVAKKLPVVSKDGPNAEAPQDEPCSICFQAFGPNADAEKNHTTSCGHTFHANCVESWLSCGGTACPICRADLVVEK
jgi:hypothetical protein